MFKAFLYAVSVNPQKVTKWRVGALFVDYSGYKVYAKNNIAEKTHAEQRIVSKLNSSAKYKNLKGNLYVTLTPCCGRNSAISCSELIAQTTQIHKVYYLTKTDPNPRIKDNGVSILGEKAEYIKMPMLEYMYYLLNIDVLIRYVIKSKFKYSWHNKTNVSNTR